MNCELCGLPTPTPPFCSDGHSFCCFGCSEVFRIFGRDALMSVPEKARREVPPSPNGTEAFLRIDGMHCSSCEILIERAASKIEGILSVEASYATSTVKVSYDPDRIEESKLPEVLSLAGYRARRRMDGAPEYDDSQALLRLFTGGILAAMVMMLYIAFFYPTDLGLVQLSQLRTVSWLAFKVVPGVILVLTSVLIFYVGWPILRGAWIGLRARSPNMDILLAIAILAAYGYSISQILVDPLKLYFDVAAVIVAVVTVGRYLEQGWKARATRELTKIIGARVSTVRVREKDTLRDKSIDELSPGEHIVIRSGEAIPVDGTIVCGQGAVDESLMTGEPFPVTRGPGERAVGGTVVVEGSIEIEVGPVIENRTDDLARTVWNVQSSIAGVQGLADRIARIFVPTVLTLATIVVVWFFVEGARPMVALGVGLATLIVSCPCSFGLAMPLTAAAGVSTALRNGIVIASGDIFEKVPKYDTVVIDRTGTLTTGEMDVVKVIGPSELAAYAAAVERLSHHPIARAIARLDASRTATDLDIHPGKGIVGTVDDRRIAVGSKTLFLILGWRIPRCIARPATAGGFREIVVSYVGWDDCAHGAILTRDQHRPEWRYVVNRLRRDSRVVMLTGAEHSSGYEDYFDAVYAGIPPEGKAAVIRRLKSDGTVAMIGDGSNDAPALAEADLGIAFGTPTPLAADAADIIIPGGGLNRIFNAFSLIGTIRHRMRQNLGWALLYNATAIPLAVTGFLNPLFAALAMSVSSLLVVWNSSRPIRSTAHGGRKSSD